MLHCNMNPPPAIQLLLEDLLADLHHARRNQDLGRLALLAYCEIRGWARQAGKGDIADWATRMFTENPCASKAEFLGKIDTLITALERHLQAYQPPDVQFSRTGAGASQHLAHQENHFADGPQS
jgi:hypothetical protein